MPPPHLALRHLALFVTESCNLACDYCFAANMEGRHIDEKLALEALASALGPANSSNELGISFWGGEPLARFELLARLVRSAQQLAARHGKRVRFSVPTNLTLLTDEMVDFFRDHAVELSLSCDGTEPSQNLRRMAGGRGSFEVVRAKLELVRQRYGERLPGVRMTVSPATAPRFYDDVRFFLELGFTHIYFAPVVEAAWPSESLAAFEVGQRALCDHWMAELRAGRPLSLPTLDKALALGEFVRRGELEPTKAVVCGAGTSMLAVDVYGDVYPCQRFVFYDKPRRTESLGSVTGGALSATRRALRLDLERLGSSERRCRDCEQLSGCVAVCPALNYRLGGDGHLVDERLCRLNAVEQRVVQYLRSRYGSEPCFRQHVGERLTKVYPLGGLSASSRALFAWLDQADTEQLATRAEEILQRLGTKRPKGRP